jgi:hypothetical protein
MLRSGLVVAGGRNKMVPERRQHTTSDVWSACETALRDARSTFFAARAASMFAAFAHLITDTMTARICSRCAPSNGLGQAACRFAWLARSSDCVWQ